nr:MAG TPA: hypothetical protein [Caudoviricetes sp.]
MGISIDENTRGFFTKPLVFIFAKTTLSIMRKLDID